MMHLQAAVMWVAFSHLRGDEISALTRYMLGKQFSRESCLDLYVKMINGNQAAAWISAKEGKGHMQNLEALKKHLYRDNQVRNIKFFPGHSRDATPEDMAREINKFFADPTNGDAEPQIEALCNA